MTKLAILAVLAATLVGACTPYEPYHHYGYGYHHYWHRNAYWRHGYWLNGAYVNANIYVDPNTALPTGVTLPQDDVYANGYVAPGVTVTAPAPATTTAPPGMVQPVQPNTASGVAP